MSELEEVKIDEVDVADPRERDVEEYEGYQQMFEDFDEAEDEEMDPSMKALLLFGGGAILAYLWATRRNPNPADLRERALRENVY